MILAGAIAAKGQLERAARLLGAGEALLESMGIRLEPADLPEHKRDFAFIRSQLAPDVLEACWNEGKAMSFEALVAMALNLDTASDL